MGVGSGVDHRSRQIVGTGGKNAFTFSRSFFKLFFTRSLPQLFHVVCVITEHMQNVNRLQQHCYTLGYARPRDLQYEVQNLSKEIGSTLSLLSACLHCHVNSCVRKHLLSRSVKDCAQSKADREGFLVQLTTTMDSRLKSFSLKESGTTSSR